MILAVLYLLSRLTGLVQASIINARLPGVATNAYWGAFDLPDLVNHLVAGGALSVTFIPIFIALKHRDENEAWEFFSALATLMSLILLTLIIICIIWAEPLIRLTKPGFVDQPLTFRLAVEMTRIMLPAQLFFYLGGMIVGVLNANKRFAASGWTGAAYNVVAIIVALGIYGIVGAQGADTNSRAFFNGALGFAIGILLGAFAGSFLLPLTAAVTGPREQRIRFQPSFHWRQPALRRFFINVLPIALGVSLPVVDQWVIGFFASYLPGDALTHLRTGNRVMLAPLGIVGQAASVAAFPYLASDSAAEDWSKFSEFLRTGLKRLLFLTLPLSALLILNAQPIINLLYSYGLYNNSYKLNQTAIAFAFYCVGLFAWGGQQLVARGFYALQDTYTPTIIGSVLTVFFVLLSWAVANVAGDAGWGVLGLAMVTSIGAGAHFLGVLFALEKKLSGPPYHSPFGIQRVIGTLTRTFIACVPMALAGLFAQFFLRQWLASGTLGKLGDLLQIIGISLVAIVVFSLAASRFSIPEWQWLQNRLLSRFTRGPKPSV